LFLMVEEQKDDGVPVEEVNYVDQVGDNAAAPSLSVHRGFSDVFNKRASPSERRFFFQNIEEVVEEPTEDSWIERKKTAWRKRHGLRKKSRVEKKAAALSLSVHRGVFDVLNKQVSRTERRFFLLQNIEEILLEEPTEDSWIERKKTAWRKRHGLRKESHCSRRSFLNDSVATVLEEAPDGGYESDLIALREMATARKESFDCRPGDLAALTKIDRNGISARQKSRRRQTARNQKPPVVKVLHSSAET
jgi:hypothetical protein